MSNAQPSRDPANDGTLVGVFNEVLGKFLQNIDDCLPARVIAFDRATNRVSVQPLVQLLTTNNERVSRGQIQGLPVLQCGGGGFGLFFNLKAGDLGWIKANDRDISLYLQSGDETTPNTLRKHSFSDAVFIPDVVRGFTIDSEDAENAVLQNLDGSVKVSLSETSIKLAVGSNNFVLDASGLTINCNVNIVGTLQNNSINIGSTHTHSGVTTGPSNTGVPT